MAVIAIFVLLAIVNFFHALVLGLSFGTEKWSNVQSAIDLVTRWLLFALAAFAGAALARERSILVAAIAAAICFVFGLASIGTPASIPATYDYLSVVVLVTATGAGAAIWKPLQKRRRVAVA